MRSIRNKKSWAETLGVVTSKALLIAAAFLFSGAVPLQSQSSNADRHITGDWVRTDLSGSGSFDGLTGHFSKANLTPEGAKIVANYHPPQRGIAYSETRVHGVGDPYIVVDRPCGAVFAGGALGVNPDSGAIHIIEQKDEVVIAPERGGVRRIYLDGRPQPDPAHWAPTGSGHGVGHYEGNVLVVDTVGLTQGPVPAGGWRTPYSHLAERFEVSPDGQHMTIHYTYTDPKLYASPHSYEYTFERLPAGSYAFEDWCDASDPKERESITIPEQK